MNKNEGKVLEVDLSSEMKKCYIDYAMSVIVDRALPDVRDGLKPVHRRIIYSMHELGLSPEKGYRKCARIVGDVLGKYHPHGDSSVYGALVRMAQDFNLRYPLVDGHGNFGSVDGDSAAAMRYTEAKMNKITLEMIRDIGKNTVDFVPNFDGEEEEPSVMPSRFPNLLVNGSSGIAVGMATNIPPHNLNEVIDAVFMLIDNSEATILELMTKIKGPDFPTAASIMGKAGIRSAYETGRGKVIVRSKTEIEEINGRHVIIVTELPYQVNKARLIENIAELVKDKKINGISDLRDESDRDGMRIVIELKRDANPQVLLNQLYKHTKLQDSFGIIMLALVNGKPEYLNLKQMLEHYLVFQEQIITRRTQFELEKANARAHLLEGLKIALDHIDEVIKIIRSSKIVREAEQSLMDKFNLSEIQSEAIVEMKLRRLTGLERDKIEDELKELMKNIEYLKSILGDRQIVLGIIKDELTEIKAKYGDERRSVIESVENEIDIEDLISEEDVVITLTHAGYIKRIPADTYTSQRRGGRGIQALATKDDDFVEHIFITSTHDHVLFFSNKGRVYRLKAYEIPEAGRTAKGTNLINLLQLNQGDKIQAIITLKEFNEDSYLIMGTKKGVIKKTSLDQYSSIRKSGLNAIHLKDDDELIDVRMTTGSSEILIVTKQGYAIRFNEQDARPLGRNAAGVRGIRLRGDDIVVSLEIIDPEQEVLVISANGFGKRTRVSEYSLQKRGGKGVITYKVTEKTGELVGARLVKDTDEMMLINSNDIVIRINVSDISTTSRNAMGVTLMRKSNDEQVVALAKIDIQDEKLILDDDIVDVLEEDIVSIDADKVNPEENNEN
ncbi:DNA gyrase subunit A [Clostridium akagii]|uniref:DNA gyrase subunit A n=1 Tax=Clostridium akagii TaxID=91623 RepID=UPI00047ECD99|nr:DNA gyrase subunit A [Clostridium akagii]